VVITVFGKIYTGFRLPVIAREAKQSGVTCEDQIAASLTLLAMAENRHKQKKKGPREAGLEQDSGGKPDQAVLL